MHVLKIYKYQNIYPFSFISCSMNVYFPPCFVVYQAKPAALHARGVLQMLLGFAMGQLIVSARATLATWAQMM